MLIGRELKGCYGLRQPTFCCHRGIGPISSQKRCRERRGYHGLLATANIESAMSDREKRRVYGGIMAVSKTACALTGESAISRIQATGSCS